MAISYILNKFIVLLFYCYDFYCSQAYNRIYMTGDCECSV